MISLVDKAAVIIYQMPFYVYFAVNARQMSRHPFRHGNGAVLTHFLCRILLIQLCADQFGRFLAAHQHAAEDGAHAEAPADAVGSHTGNK